MKIGIFVPPVLFSLFNVLFMFVGKIGIMHGSNAFLYILLGIVGGILVTALAIRLFQERGALWATLLFVVVFAIQFVQGHLRLSPDEWAKVKTFASSDLFRGLLFVGLLIVIGVILRREVPLRQRMRFLVVVPMVLIALSIAALRIKSTAMKREAALAAAKAKKPYRPNIFYIVLDGYGRNETLDAIYGHDNLPFLGFLQEKGFYVAKRSHSNYSQTALSLASSLNMAYLDPLKIKHRPKPLRRLRLRRLIDKSEVRSFLKTMGYDIISLPTVYNPLHLQDADNALHVRLFRYDALIFEIVGMVRYKATKHRTNDGHRQAILSSIETLKNLSKFPGPNFILAHILAPHPPFVFDPDGKMPDHSAGQEFTFADANHFMATHGVSAADYRLRYRAQIEYLNSRVKEVVTAILSNSTVEPVIIIQGDHGPGAVYSHDHFRKNVGIKERFAILNAYYLPRGGGARLYPSITPVNTFRVVLNHLFGATYEPLKDRSFYSTWSKPYGFTEVSGKLDSPLP